MTSIDDENVFSNFAKSKLQQHAEQLDELTTARLRAARKRALDTEPHGQHLFWLPASVTASALAVLLTITLWQGEPAVDQHVINGEWEQVATSEDLDLVEELEFYQWLETLEQSAKPQRANQFV